MIEFRPITLADKSWIDPIVLTDGGRSADYNFGNLYLWNRLYRQLICRVGDRLLVKQRHNGIRSFYFPIGTGDFRQPIEALREFTDARGYPLLIRGVEEHNRELLESAYPHCFSWSEDIDNADYIHLAERLSTYAGKALHGKKNHCNRFEAEHNWEFRPLTRDLIPLCMDMMSSWIEENSERLAEGISYEYEAISRAFAAYEDLGLEGGVLFADGRVAGFSVGELCARDCFDVHFEKADTSLNGAYSMVCREMARLAMASHPELVYINREEDMGLEGLRRSKLSYKPEYLLTKYIARWNYD